MAKSRRIRTLNAGIPGSGAGMPGAARRWLAGALALLLLAGAACAEAPSGEDALWLEQRLAELGYIAAADGVFDEDSTLALESFQKANGLEISGRADDATRLKLRGEDCVSRQAYLQRSAEASQAVSPMKNGDFGAEVQVMQHRLIDNGYYDGKADGRFDDATQAALERFQRVNGIPVTGVADGATLTRLMADTPVTWQGFLSEMSAKSDDVGLNVYVLQRTLRDMGYFKGDCTGNFSDLTQQAVIRFQADNGLEATGVADAATWAVIYSGGAVTRARANAIKLGDGGEHVKRVQERLIALGYLTGEPGDSYDYATETAVRLFQMAHGLSVSGDVDGQTLSRLMGGDARAMDDAAVTQSFEALLAAYSGDVRPLMAEYAGQLLGEAFVPRDDALYPGFSLAQYVCVAAGLPVTRPETLIQLAGTPVAAATEVEAGNLVALQTTDSDSVTMLLSIGVGDGRVIYATAQTGWVVMSYIDQLGSASVYRWANGAGAAP